MNDVDKTCKCPKCGSLDIKNFGIQNFENCSVPFTRVRKICKECGEWFWVKEEDY